MKVGEVGVAVVHWAMDVGVGVRLAGWIAFGMGVLVMEVVDVGVGMLN